MALFVKIFEHRRDRESERERDGHVVDGQRYRTGGGEEGQEKGRGLARAGELYFSRVVIKVYYANEIMSAPLFYRG